MTDSICNYPGCSNAARILKSGKIGQCCSTKCQNRLNSLKGNEKRKETWKNKTKEETDLSTEKRKKTCMEKYGVEASFLKEWELTEEIRHIRSNNMKKINSDPVIQQKRLKGFRDFLNSDKGIEYKKSASVRTKRQHCETDLEDKVRNYFKTAYIGSDDQNNRRIRMIENNPSKNPEIMKKIIDSYINNRKNGKILSGVKRKKYNNTGLYYQGSFEKDFLDYCFGAGFTNIENAPVLNDEIYPGRYYEPDFLLEGKYIIEVKSWYIEQLQEKNNPGILQEKQNLVERAGFIWVYVKDKDYSVLHDII